MPNLWSNKVCVLIQTKNFLFLFFNLLLPIKTQTWKKQKSPFNKFYISNLIFCLAWSPCLSTPWAKRGRHSDIFYQCSAPLLNSSCCYWVVIYTCALFEPGFLESKSPHISGAKPPKNFLSLDFIAKMCGNYQEIIGKDEKDDAGNNFWPSNICLHCLQQCSWPKSKSV